MPNRILKESICSSEKLSGLTDFQFRLWVHLITYVDDYGRGDARPAIIKGTCFPLRDRVTVKDIDAALHALAGAGCVSLYEVDGKPYLYFPRWGEHQRIQTKRSKYPAPEKSTVGNGDSPPESNPIQSNPNTNPNPNPNPNPTRGRARESDGGGEPFALFSEGQPELREALDGYAAMRAQMGKPLTARARQKLVDKLELFPQREWIAIIDQATTHNWLDFYAPDRAKTAKKDDNSRRSYDLDRAQKQMMTTVPQVKKKKKGD